MKNKIIGIALAAMVLAGCNGGFKKGEAGMQYKIISGNGGPTIKPGDFFTINFIIKTDADSVLASSYENGREVPQLMQKSQTKGDVFAGLAMLSEGDSAIIKTNIDSTSKGRPRQPGLKGKYMVYVIKVEKVIPKGNLSPEAFAAKYKDYLKSRADIAKKQEPAKIKKYIDDNKLKLTQTPSGLQYVITTQGTGIKPVAGDTVQVNYIGKFTSGKVFDTSIKSEAQKAKLQINPMNPYKPIKFPVGVAGMIPGWNEAFLLFNKGTKATMILPSNLAYGEQGNQIIGPFTPLVFDVELVDVIHPNPNAPKPVIPKMPVQQAPVHPAGK